MKHVAEAGRSKLVVIMTKHVDDLKFAGTRAEVTSVLQQIEQVFGKLKTEWPNFTNCGVRHTKDKVTKAVSLDQVEYASALRTIAHAELSSKKSDEAAG